VIRGYFLLPCHFQRCIVFSVYIFVLIWISNLVTIYKIGLGQKGMPNQKCGEQAPTFLDNPLSSQYRYYITQPLKSKISAVRLHRHTTVALCFCIVQWVNWTLKTNPHVVVLRCLGKFIAGIHDVYSGVTDDRLAVTETNSDRKRGKTIS